MKKTFATLLLALITSFATAGPVETQGSKDAALVKIPFNFILDAKLFRAGTYQLWSESSDWESMNIAKEGSTTVLAFVRTYPIRNFDPGDGKVHVQFKNYFGQYFLEFVQLPRSSVVHEVRVSRLNAMRTLAHLNLMPTENADDIK